MSRGILFVMSGPSGTGKGTICKMLTDTENIFLSVSSTTREIRKDEIDGVTYNYITKEQFEGLIANGEMLEYATYNENYYGTPRGTVESMLAAGRNVLLEIEPQGALKVKNVFPDAVLVFVAPPSVEELKRRLLDRGRESAEQIEERLSAAKWELEQSAKYNYVVVNDDLIKCVNEIAKILHSKEEERGLIDKLITELN